MTEYSLIDCGNHLKFEQFGSIALVRPSPLAIWQPKLHAWKSKDAVFHHKLGWNNASNVPSAWTAQIKGLNLEIRKCNSGNVGLFPEHLQVFSFIEKLIQPKDTILNLFAYTGLLSLLMAKKKAQVCHVDASKVSVEWAKKNAKLNHLDKGIRWIVDDAIKFLKREEKRKSLYNGIVLDPPTFGRGSQGQVFKFEKHINTLLSLSKKILKQKSSFVALSCHTPGISPLVLKQIFEEEFSASLYGELIIYSKQGNHLPCGSYVIFQN